MNIFRREIEAESWENSILGRRQREERSKPIESSKPYLDLLHVANENIEEFHVDIKLIKLLKYTVDIQLVEPEIHISNDSNQAIIDKKFIQQIDNSTNSNNNSDDVDDHNAITQQCCKLECEVSDELALQYLNQDDEDNDDDDNDEYADDEQDQDDSKQLTNRSDHSKNNNNNKNIGSNSQQSFNKNNHHNQHLLVKQ